MQSTRTEILTAEQIAHYVKQGFVESLAVLTPEEVQFYRDQVDQTCAALGGRVTRLDGLHLFFLWAWQLATHPRLLDCMEALLGPNILLKSTRLFYKHGNSAAYVGWHQDGITERVTDGRVPAIWLGLTEATVENGCLRVVPRSHRVGMLGHYLRRDGDDLASCGTSDQEPVPSATDDHEVSIKLANLPDGLDPPHDIVMRAGELSFHHPLALHGSNPNRSTGPRIGFSATYSTPELYKGSAGVALVRGHVTPTARLEVLEKPPTLPFDEAVEAYRASGRQILCSPIEGSGGSTVLEQGRPPAPHVVKGA